MAANEPSNLEAFRRMFNISHDDLSKSGLLWDELQAILELYDDESTRKDYLQTGVETANRISRMRGVHSTRSRVKNRWHVGEKIVRKRCEDLDAKRDRFINIDNFLTELTDLIGVRALHLLKNDWIDIHEQVSDTYEFAEKPKFYYRFGDWTEEDADELEKLADVEAQVHKSGYRSVHYLLKTGPKAKQVVELQVRTLFEEGWSEIDHRVRYPYQLNNNLLNETLLLFNTLANQSDAMAGYVITLKEDLAAKAQSVSELQSALAAAASALDSKTSLTSELQKTVDELRAKLAQAESAQRAPLLASGQVGTPKLKKWAARNASTVVTPSIRTEERVPAPRITLGAKSRRELDDPDARDDDDDDSTE